VSSWQRYRAWSRADTPTHGAPLRKGSESTDIQVPVGSGGTALVAMMKPTDLREGDDLALIGWLYRARLWAILSEGEVDPGLVIIPAVGRQELPEVLFVQDDDRD
jgi:hypothetical protein